MYLALLTIFALIIPCATHTTTAKKTPQKQVEKKQPSLNAASKKKPSKNTCPRKKQQKNITKPAQPAPAAPTPAPTAQPAGKQRTITISNNIKNSMLTYKYGFISYSPSSFTILLDDKTVEPGTKATTTVTDNQLTIRYNYEFLGGKRKGSKLVTFEVAQDTAHLDMTFSWHDKWHIIFDKATPKTIVAA